MKINMYLERDNPIILAKKELIKLLKLYKGILTDSIYSYLNSLVNLEFSVLKDYIPKQSRLVLTELDIYRKIAIYNIYNRALNIFNESNLELDILGIKEGIYGLIIYSKIKNATIKLFDFNYNDDSKHNSESYKLPHIGDISLFITKESKEKRQAELARVLRELENLYSAECPYLKNSNYYGSPRSHWYFEHQRKIAEYEAEFKMLDAKKELTDAEKLEIEIKEKIHELLLDDYGLTEEDFKDESKEETELIRTLILKEPGLNIRNNIKYI